MLKHIMKIAVAVAFSLVMSSAALSQENKWSFGQKYSNADGSVQFIVLGVGPFDPQMSLPELPVLAGKMLVASDGKTEHTFTFPDRVLNYNSSFCEANESIFAPGAYCYPVAYALVATQGFADLNVVTPDFVVPNGFLFLPSGSVRLGASVASYMTPPDDGWVEAVNNAGDYYSFSAPNYTGLWWAAPAGSEAGWGINFAHQGNIIFATWFTYDAAGRPSWLAMTAGKIPRSNYYYGEQLYEGVYIGSIYSFNGPPFSAFVPQASGTLVGWATLSLTSATTGQFSFSLASAPGFSATKAITLQTFGPVPTCVWRMQPDLTKATNYQGLWWSAPSDSEPGWGVNLTQQGTTIFATWFTYKANRDSLWLSVTAKQTAPNTFSGALDLTTGSAFYSTHFGPVQHHPAGTATFTFTDGNTGTFTYEIDLGDGVNKATQSKAITRQVFRPPGTVCQ